MQRINLERSIWKPVLLMGCERVPFLAVALSSVALVMEGSLWVKIGGVIYFALAIAVIAWCNSKEPFFFRMCYRYLQYQDFYPSNALYPGKSDRPNYYES